MKYGISEVQTDRYYGINYIDNWKGNGPRIGVWQGLARGGREVSGITLEPQNFLKSPHIAFIERTKCAWFLPYVERMARGEDVSLEEIKEAYRLNNAGADLPTHEN